MTNRLVYTIPKPGTFQGPPGAQGPEGPQGPTGPSGPDTELRARVDPGTDAPASGRHDLISLDGIKSWKKRSNLVVATDHANLAAALADLPAAGGTLAIDADGPFTVPDAGLTIPAKARLIAWGSRAAVLTAPVTATGAAVITTAASATGIVIEGIDVDCTMHGTMTKAFNFEHNVTATDRDIRLIDCVARNAADYGFYTWTSRNIIMERCKALDCVYGFYIDSLKGFVRLVNPYAVNAVAGRMRFGIRATSSFDTAQLDIIAPYISGADYASEFGAEAHGISISGAAHWHIEGGLVTLCGNPANKQGGGLVAATSHQGSAANFSANKNHAVGIWSELEPSGDTTLGTAGEIRGAQYTNIHINENGSAGMSGSFGAGTVVMNVEAARNGREGIVWDCDGFMLNGFRVYNNWQDAGASAPPQNGGAKAGVRTYVGNRSIISNGHCYDNQAVKTQAYGIAADSNGHILTSIVTRTADHITGGLVEGAPGTANTKTAVVT